MTFCHMFAIKYRHFVYLFGFILVKKCLERQFFYARHCLAVPRFYQMKEKKRILGSCSYGHKLNLTTLQAHVFVLKKRLFARRSKIHRHRHGSSPERMGTLGPTFYNFIHR